MTPTARTANGPITRMTSFVLAHKRLVVAFWVLLTLIGAASAGSSTKALKQKFTVPGREGFVTNQQISHQFRGTGGNNAPLLAVVTLPSRSSVSSAPVRAQLSAVEARLRATLPGARVGGYASTGSAAFTSRDGHTTFVVAYPPLDPKQSFNDNPEAAKHAIK